MTILNASKNVEKQDVSYIAGGDVKCCSHSENFFGSVFKISKHTTHRTSNYTLGHLSQINKTYGLHKNLYMLFLADLFVLLKNSKEAKSLSIGEWLSKLVYPHHEILLNNEKK